MTMKKLSLIILALCIFSIGNTTFAQSIDDLLELDSGLEAFSIETQKLDTYSFRSPQIESVYQRFIVINRILKDELMRKYRNGDFDYYQMQWIIKNHKDFVFHTNKLFYYLSLKDNGMQSKPIDTAIMRSYQGTKTSYNRMKYIISKSY